MWPNHPVYSTTVVAILLCVASAVPVIAQIDSPRPLEWQTHITIQDQTIASPEVIPLQDLEQMALRNNPTLAQAAARIGAAKGQRLQAGFYPNPVVGYRGEDMGDDSHAGIHGFFVSQEIIGGGKRQLDVRAAHGSVLQAERLLDLQRQRVINDVRVQFYQAVYAQQMIELAQQLVGIGQSAVAAAEALRASAEVSLVEVLQSRVESSTAALSLEKARMDHLAAWRRLSALVGNPQLQPAPLDAADHQAAELNFEDELARLQTQSPQLTAAEADVERAAWVYRRATRQSIPNLEFETAVRYNDATNHIIGDLQLAIPLPVHDCNEGNIRRTRFQWIAAQQEVERIRLALRYRLAEQFRRYDAARRQTDIYTNQILPDARASLNLVLEGYRQQEFNSFELLTAQRTYFRAVLTRLDAMRELRISAVLVDGLLVTGGLDAVP